MHPDRFRYSSSNCSIARTLGVVGEKWTLLVLREAVYGVRRFDDFHAALGCARNLLSARLKTLVDNGLLEKQAYRDDHGRRRDEYRLTRPAGSVAAGRVGSAPISALWKSAGPSTAFTGSKIAGRLRASSVLEPPGCAAAAMVDASASSWALSRRCSS